jgi:hypothetical protein
MGRFDIAASLLQSSSAVLPEGLRRGETDAAAEGDAPYSMRTCKMIPADKMPAGYAIRIIMEFLMGRLLWQRTAD